MARAQEVSALLTEYIRGQRADPALYERMARTDAAGIDWVERSTLEDWRVVTGPFFDEWMEVRNVIGSAALFLAQSSLYGDNSMSLICGERGLVGVAALNKPKPSAYGRLELAIDGSGITIPDYRIVQDTESIVRVAFEIPGHLDQAIAEARSFGTRIVIPAGTLFFGFEMGIRDARLRQMVEGCRPASAPASTSAMRVAQGVDYPGGDMTDVGLRGIELGACLALCEGDRACRAVSYVTKKKWCWPKASVGRAVAAPGVVSAVK